MIDRGNSFSRVAVYPRSLTASAILGTQSAGDLHGVDQIRMNIDGGSGDNVWTVPLCRKDIDHLGYDVTTMSPIVWGERARRASSGSGAGATSKAPSCSGIGT